MKITRRAALGALGRCAVSQRPASSARRARRNRCASDCSAIWAARIAMSADPATASPSRLAIADFGGSVLGRPIEVMQGDDQNKPDVASSLAREWIDNQGVDVLADGAASSAGLAIQQVAREKKRIYLISRPTAIRHDRQAVLAVRHPLRLRHLRAGARHGQRARPRPVATAGSSSPPTTRSATSLEATPSEFVRPPAARCSGSNARRSAPRIFPPIWCRRRRRAPR